MNRLLTFIVFAAFIVSCSVESLPVVEEVPAGAEEEAQPCDTGVFVPGKTIVLLSEELSGMVEEELASGTLTTKSDGLNDIFAGLGVKSARRLFPYAGEFEPRTRKEGLHRWYILEYEENVSRTKADADLGSFEGIELVEPVRRAVPAVHDDVGAESWDMLNTGHPGFDINVVPVWKYYTTGSSDVTVAVVDGGIDLTHEDLSWNCATAGNFNFVDNNNAIYPQSHGTHVAGTIAAAGNNSKGMAGVAGGNYAAGKRGVTLLSCQIFKTVTNYGQSYDKTGDIPAAIKWGADHGAVISQNSWGYNYDSNGDGVLTGSELQTALRASVTSSDKVAIDYFIKYAGCDNDGNQLPDSPMKGGLVVFAAGNDGIANSAPANYSEVIAVGAINSDGTRASYSNYGSWVDLAAPGTDIYSTVPGGKYDLMTGTSMACPHVSGAAALIVSYFGGQGFTNEMLKERLLNGRNTSAIPESYELGGLLDVYGSFSYGEDFVPEAVSDLSAKAISNNIELQWTVTADERGIPAGRVLVLYSKDRDAVAAADPDNCQGVMTAGFALGEDVGQKVSRTVERLDFNSDYYLKACAGSYSGKYAAASSIVKASTGSNNPPVISFGQEGDFTLQSYMKTEIPINITDPDGHAITVSYTAGSAADALVQTGSGAYSIGMDCLKTEPGTYTAHISVTDEYGASCSKDFTYTILVNHAPEVVNECAGFVLETTGKAVSADLTGYISDPDGEIPVFEAVSSDKQKIYAAVDGQTLTCTSLAYGICDVTVKATDARGLTCTMSFKVGVPDPSVPVLVYPSQVRDYLNISTGMAATAKVTIRTSAGNSVYSASEEVSCIRPLAVDMRECAPGRYSVRIETGGKEYVRNIVKL